MEDESTSAEFGPGELLFFKRGTVHAQPKIPEDPVVFLSIDTPRRDQRTSCLSIRRTAHPKVSLGPISNICSFWGHSSVCKKLYASAPGDRQRVKSESL